MDTAELLQLPLDNVLNELRVVVQELRGECEALEVVLELRGECEALGYVVRSVCDRRGC